MLMIEKYVKDIRNALENKSYYSALALALTLPDVCGVAEYPNKKNVSERYISWYDKYIGDNLTAPNQLIYDSFNQPPYLSGEMVYNLRNLYLHQGSLNVDVNKMKEDVNKVDMLITTVGDGPMIPEMSLDVGLGTEPLVKFRVLLVNVSHICGLLCDGALEYYKRNSDKFKFAGNVIHLDHVSEKESPSVEIPKDYDFIGDILTKKFKVVTGQDIKLEDNLTEKYRRRFEKILIDSGVVVQDNQGEKTTDSKKSTYSNGTTWRDSPDGDGELDEYGSDNY